MRATDVIVGECYTVKVSGQITAVKILAAKPSGGFRAINLATNREVNTRSAARLRRRLGDETAARNWMHLVGLAR